MTAEEAFAAITLRVNLAIVGKPLGINSSSTGETVQWTAGYRDVVIGPQALLGVQYGRLYLKRGTTVPSIMIPAEARALTEADVAETAQLILRHLGVPA